MHLTYFGANSWLLQLGQQTILIDPWLVDSLVFGNLPWFFKGDKPEALDLLPAQIDLILLSQGLEDHAHKPTLKKLDKTIPVAGSPSATEVVKELGYTQVTTLEFGQTFTLANQIEIRTLPGAPLGPFQQENGYILKDLESGKTLYYEPHGYPSQEIKDYAPVDVVISPIVSLELPLLGPIIQGDKTALQLAEWVQPQVFLPTAAGGDVQYEGILDSFITSKGSIDKLRSQLAEANLSTQVIEPQARKTFELELSDSRVMG